MHGRRPTRLRSRTAVLALTTVLLASGGLAAAGPAGAQDSSPTGPPGRPTGQVSAAHHWDWPEPDDDWGGWGDDGDGGADGGDAGPDGGDGDAGPDGDGDGAPPDDGDGDGDGEVPTPTVPTTPRLALTRQVTANVAFDLSAGRQRADVLTAVRGADVVGWQEITTRAQVGAITDLRGWSTYWPGGWRRDGKVSLESVNANPISWRTGTWRRVSAGHRLASLAIPGVCRDRHLSWVVLQHRRSGVRVLRWNIHFVPAAWVDRAVSFKAMRQAAWTRQAQVVASLLAAHSRAGHAAVIGGGDVNRRAAFLGDRVVYDTGHDHIDYLTHVPSARVYAYGPVRAEMNSDHDKLSVTYAIHR